jgi:hypothetical protein
MDDREAEATLLRLEYERRKAEIVQADLAADRARGLVRAAQDELARAAQAKAHAEYWLGVVAELAEVKGVTLENATPKT